MEADARTLVVFVLSVIGQYRSGRLRDGLVLFRRGLLKPTLAHQTGLMLECELSKFV